MAVRSVLLIERDPHRASLLDLFLHGRGYDVTVAPCVPHALRAAVTDAPDIVLIGDAEVSTSSLARAIGRLSQAPIVMLEAQQQPHEILDAIREASRADAESNA